MTPAMMEIIPNSLAVNLPDGSALIYQALSKSLPFTNKSLKMGMLSVNDLSENSDYGQNGQKWPFVRKNSDVSDPVLRTNAPKSGFCP